MTTISLVGYTNTGKSTLLNNLAKDSILAENKLFATLDPTTRKVWLSPSRTVLVTDTVGFIHNLPKQLYEAFKATFEEVESADILLHVIDMSHPYVDEQIAAVRAMLHEMGVDDIPIIDVYNKSDLMQDDDEIFVSIGMREHSVTISSKTGDGIDLLLEKLSEMSAMYSYK